MIQTCYFCKNCQPHAHAPDPNRCINSNQPKETYGEKQKVNYVFLLAGYIDCKVLIPLVLGKHN